MMYSKNAFKERLKIIYWEQSLPEFQFIKKILLFVWKDLHNDRFPNYLLYHGQRFNYTFFVCEFLRERNDMFS